MSKNEFSCDCNIIHHDIVAKVSEKMLPEDKFTAVSVFFKVLGDKTRMKIAWALSQNEMCVCDLANVLDMTKSAVSHQLSTLRNAHLVKFRREGNLFRKVSLTNS